MTTARRQILLGTAIAFAAVALSVIASGGGLSHEAAAPSDARSLGAWMNRHPADWRAANALAAAALDTDLPQRFELWRAAFAHASRLAPGAPNVTTSFVRGGLLHWYELGAADRAQVLRQAAPLLRRHFSQMYRPLWNLTRDFEYLRRNAPATDRALVALRDLAVTHGLFSEYRTLRDDVEAKHPEAASRRENADLRYGLLEWVGTCGNHQVCGTAWRAFPAARAGEEITLTLENVQSDEVPPYVEIYLDGSRVAEGVVAGRRDFTIRVPAPGLKRVEVRLANPRTRNGIQRRVRLS